MNILFVCSRNQWRSPTAEAIFRNYPDIQVKSAGTGATARIKISEKLVNWADLILVMEKKHRQRLQHKFNLSLLEKQIQVLDIPDDYQYMDPELIEMLKVTVQPYLLAAAVYKKRLSTKSEEYYND